MKKILLFLGFILSTLPVFSQNEERNSISYPTPGEISIVASTPIPEGIESTHQNYIDLIKCGFNLGMSSGTMDFFLDEFDKIGNLNFKYLVQNPDLHSNKRDIWIKKFKNNRYFAGWKFWDEPKFNDLENLRNIYSAQLKADPNNLIYVNLVGGLDKLFTGDYKSFNKYLEDMESLIHPEIWSYDFYPILIKNRELRVNYTTFYSALESFRQISKRTNKPFWAYCESMEYFTDTYSRPAATEAYLRFEAFSALAYGAQGIVYWTYGQRKPVSTENYTSALVNLDGKRSNSWYAAQKVNQEIKKFNYIFYKCNVKEVKHTGLQKYGDTPLLSGAFSSFKKIESGTSGVVLSLIENKGKEYIVIVSRDVLRSQKLKLHLQPGKDVEYVYGIGKSYKENKGIISYTLDKGGYLIFQVSDY